ncbi:hypothetical protein [Chryseobacterium sp. GP-SGM7]|uniref:hypothetical protein n=1 Tax=Chryseobacterium sp. GP-SGM7 TaxID=3411323 RepID=UPI003B92CE21
MLKPVYFSIKNPDFILLYLGLIIISVVFLQWFNGRKFQKTINLFHQDSFVFDLNSYELIYLKNGNISSAINGSICELIDNGSIKINADKTISTCELTVIQSREQQQIMDLLNQLGKTSYSNFLAQLLLKPVFLNIAKSMNSLKKYVTRSKILSNLFVLNFIVFLSLIMFGFLRIATGILHEKPIFQISFIVILLTFFMIGYLFRLTNLFNIKFLPDVYKKVILTKKEIKDDWQWNYFLMGTAVLTTSFIPLTHRNISDGSSNTCGTSSSSSYSSCGGSSCSSCGGCGGD